MNRFRARVFSGVVAAALAAAFPPATPAQTVPSNAAFWFAGTRLIFDRPVPLGDDVAVSIRDSGLQRLLARVGASLAYAPQQRYVAVTSADRRVITFAVGSPLYTVAGVESRAPFAPFLDGGDVIVPLLALARSLYVTPLRGDAETVLQPQLGGLDIRPDGRRTIVTLHGATELHYSKAAETPERVTLEFGGLGSTLAATRRVGGGVDEVDVRVAGGPKNPTATVTIAAPRGSRHAIVESTTPQDLTIVFAPAGVALDARVAASPVPVAQAAPTMAPVTLPAPTPAAAAAPIATPPAAPEAQPTPQTGPATVTSVAIEPHDDGVNVRLGIDGTATYDWHRLLDDRWYVDIHNAILSGSGRDERPNLPAVDSIRVRQIGTSDAPAVRVAFTLRGSRRIDVTPATGGLTLAVANALESDPIRTGNGQIGGATVAQSSEAAPAGPPVAPIAPQPDATPWKFGGGTAGSRVIVIDPGHGGGDIGTAHNGLTEKILTLEISMRLRALLAQQGWNVKLTRDRDIDPVSPETMAAFASDGKPNPTDRAYLQTRCDVANLSNARLFISIHINYSPSPAASGTTIYYTKPQDVPLAQALERSLVPAIGTKDDGIVHGNLYVTKHTTMPAVLIETAFVSNAGDAQLLGDPAFLQNVAAGIAAGVKAYAGALPALSSKADQ